MQETIPLDLPAFIEDELKPLRLPNFSDTSRQEQLAWRMYGFAAWYRHDIRFSEALRNLLPGRYKSPELQRKLQTSLDKEIQEIFQRANVYARLTTLFNKPFHTTVPGKFKNWLVALKLINEVVLDDEYCARKYITKDAVVVDAGANIGVFSALAATLAHEGKVYAFEPTKATFAVLRENCQPYSNIFTVQSGLGNKVGDAELGIENSTGVGNSLVTSGLAESYGDREVVPVTTIDTFVRENALARVDFIKMDTEGFEKEILEGAKETIKKFRPTIVMSAYHKPGDPETLRDLVSSYCSEYRFELKRSPELDLVCTVPKK